MCKYSFMAHEDLQIDSCSVPSEKGHHQAAPTVVWTFAPTGVGQTQEEAAEQGETVTLGQLTTMGVGGPVGTYVEATDQKQLIEAVAGADETGLPLLMVGGGSNILASDQPFNGVVVRDMRQELKVLHDSGCGGVEFVASGGYPWDELVRVSVENEWSGLEALSGIPGTVGAAPVQNIGAYGAEAADLIAAVITYDRLNGKQRTLTLSELEFEYRNSILKRSQTCPDAGGGRAWGLTPRWVVLSVIFHTRPGTLSAPIRYSQLAQALGVEVGTRVPAEQVRSAVIELRRSKGMVLDTQDPDTRSAGSFFTNPIVTAQVAAALPQQAPRYPVAGVEGQDGLVKTSAAWLIEHAGFAKGFGISPQARVTLSTKHTLALTNRGGASGREVAALASIIVAGVEEKFGITLVPEPVQVGFNL